MIFFQRAVMLALYFNTLGYTNCPIITSKHKSFYKLYVSKKTRSKEMKLIACYALIIEIDSEDIYSKSSTKLKKKKKNS